MTRDASSPSRPLRRGHGTPLRGLDAAARSPEGFGRFCRMFPELPAARYGATLDVDNAVMMDVGMTMPSGQVVARRMGLKVLSGKDLWEVRGSVRNGKDNDDNDDNDENDENDENDDNETVLDARRGLLKAHPS
jgi:hypothetical protein